MFKKIFIKLSLASFAHFSSGVSIGWPSPAYPKLLEPESRMSFTSDDGGWLAFANQIGILAATIPSSWLMDKYTYTPPFYSFF